MKKNATHTNGNQGKIVHYILPERKKTLRARVLAHLLRGNRLTSLDGLRLFHTLQLPAVIFGLRHEYGFDIHTEDVEHLTTDGRKITIARYHLPTPSLAQEEIESFCKEVQ